LDALISMPEFLQLLPPQEALERLLANLPAQVIPESVESISAVGRVTAEAVLAPYPLPSFPRSTVDGYALRAQDTYGASEGLPAYFKVAGEVPMGDSPPFKLGRGECALIHTGGMLPENADAVVMVEHSQSVRPGEVEVLKAAAPSENVLRVGEDVASGQVVIPPGRRLRPADIGGLMALGITRLQAARRPQAGILSSGDEVVSPELEIKPGQVRDVNSYSLSALVEEAGGRARRYGIIPDRADELLICAQKALAECDLVVITAGSSASTRDLTAQVINRLGAPGVLVHGVNVRPGKPTILGVCNQKSVIGLPGNPVSALMIAGLFVTPVIEALCGLSQERLRAMVTARLTINLPSQAGREDWIPVSLRRKPQGFEAEPIFGKSNLIFTLARADGLVRIPPDATGLSAGEFVDVFLS
jgi:molybdopterin molybdotransferase